MVLDFQNLPIPFGQGIDTSYNPAAIPIGKLSELENAVFTQAGALNKRNGYSALSNNILGSVFPIESAKASAVYNNTDLLTFDGNRIYSWLDSMQKWSDRGNCTAASVNYRDVIANTYQQTNPDVAYHNGIELYAWEDSRGGIRYTMIDSITRSQLVTDQLIAPAGSMPKCLILGDYFLILYYSAEGRLLIASIPPGNPANASTYFIADNPDMSNVAFDAVVGPNTSYVDGYLYITYNASDGYIYIKTFDSNLTLLSTQPISSDTSTAITCFSDGYYVWVAFGNLAGETKLFVTAFGYLLFGNIVDTGHIISHITGITYYTYPYLPQLPGAPFVQLYYDINTGLRPFIQGNSVTYDGSAFIGTSTLFKKTVSIASKVWTYNDRFYLNTVFDSPLQPTYFTLNNLAEVVAKEHESVAGGFRTGQVLTEVVIPTSDGYNVDGRFLSATEKRGAIVTNDNIIYSLKGIAASELDFINSYKSATLSQTLHLSGGVLQAYDGNNVVEHGFNVFPDTPINGGNAHAGSIEDGTHSWQFTYEWTDNRGQVYRSAPCPAVTIDLQSSGANDGSVAFSIPSLALTKKANVRIVVYRTQSSNSGDPLLYRVTTINTPLLNDPTADYVIFVDTFADTTIVANNVLYCSPDTTAQLIELENIAAPNCTIITTYKNRIFLAGLDNPNQIWYSKTVVPGEPAAFNDILSLDIDPKGQEITGLAVMDGNLIIFKRNSIFLLSGVGPTNTGAQNDFNDPQMIASDVGCTNQSSIVLVSSLGLFFQSSKGIYLLNRSMQTTYVGAPVERYNVQNIVAGVQIPDTTQVRFISSDGNALMYDYYFDQWGTFTNHIAVDAGVWLNKFFFLKSTGVINQEVPGQYMDIAQSINIKITTGWLSFAELQGYQKVRSFMFLGDYHGRHILKISAAYDGAESFVNTTQIDTTTIDTASVFDINIYGENEIYGENGIYGGTFADEQFRIFIRRQRCQRIKITIQEQQPLVGGNRGLTFVAMTWQVGVKKGLGKVAATHQFGVR